MALYREFRFQVIVARLPETGNDSLAGPAKDQFNRTEKKRTDIMDYHSAHRHVLVSGRGDASHIPDPQPQTGSTVHPSYWQLGE